MRNGRKRSSHHRIQRKILAMHSANIENTGTKPKNLKTHQCNYIITSKIKRSASESNLRQRQIITHGLEVFKNPISSNPTKRESEQGQHNRDESFELHRKMSLALKKDIMCESNGGKEWEDDNLVLTLGEELSEVTCKESLANLQTEIEKVNIIEREKHQKASTSPSRTLYDKRSKSLSAALVYSQDSPTSVLNPPHHKREQRNEARDTSARLSHHHSSPGICRTQADHTSQWKANFDDNFPNIISPPCPKRAPSPFPFVSNNSEYLDKEADVPVEPQHDGDITSDIVTALSGFASIDLEADQHWDPLDNETESDLTSIDDPFITTKDSSNNTSQVSNPWLMRNSSEERDESSHWEEVVDLPPLFKTPRRGLFLGKIV